MLSYYASFIILSLLSLLAPDQKHSKSSIFSSGIGFIIFLFFVFFIGLRHEVGCDWDAYLHNLELVDFGDNSIIFAFQDPAYQFFNILGKYWGGIYLVNTLCAFFFTICLFYFAYSQKRPWLILVSAVPYLINVVAMGYTRQSVAISFGLLAIIAISKNAKFGSAILIFVGILFHKSILVLTSIYVVFMNIRNIFLIAFLMIFGLTLFYFFVSPTLERYLIGYVDANYDASGALIKIILTTIPSLIFIIFRSNLSINPLERKVWTLISLVGISFLPLYFIFPSTTALYRISLYFLPIQLYVLSMLPELFSRGKKVIFWNSLSVLYSFFVMTVWLNFAGHAGCWVPYNSYIFEAMF